MGTEFKLLRLVFFVLIAAALTPRTVSAQTVGTVTALQGQALLTRAGNRSDLRFRDGLILRDAIDTREQSLVRILFGGKSTVTVRELSRLDVSEELVPGGGTRTTHDLPVGAVLLRVVRQLLNTGDEIRIQTPNAVAAVRGTTLFAQYIRELEQTTFTVINGSASVTPLGFAALTLTTGQSVTITGTLATGIVVGSIRAISQAEATRILNDAEVTPAFREEAARGPTVRELEDRAGQEPLRVGSATCWPYTLCESQGLVAGRLASLPLPVGSSTNLGSKGSSGVTSSVVLVKGSGT